MEDPYLDVGGILRNLPGLTSASDLAAFEARATRLRLTELRIRRLEGNYDVAHLKAFHRHIFEDVYDWAGEFRIVDIFRDDAVFGHWRHVAFYLQEVFSQLREVGYLRGGSRDEFVVGAAHLLSEINAVHPFREGNGRTQRALLSQLARDRGLRLVWDRLAPERNIEISIASRLGNEEPMREALDYITVVA